MNIHDAFPSAFINAASLNGQTHTVIIERFEQESEMPDGTKKPAVYFNGRNAGLILNKTNATVLESMLGAETDNWIGKTIDLRVEKVSFQGSMVDGVRVAPPAATAQQAQQPRAKKQAKKPEPQWVEEDDVPF